MTFWLTLAAGVGVLAASGHCMTARWAFAPVCGFDFWRVIVTSPEVLIFLFFMITDPKTVPAGRVGRVAFGVARRRGQHAADGAADRRVRDQGRPARRPRRRVRGPSRARPRCCPHRGRPATGSARSPPGWRRAAGGAPPAAAPGRRGRSPSSSASASASSPPARRPAAPSPSRPTTSSDGLRRDVDPATFPTITVEQDVADWNHEIAGPVAQRARAGPRREPRAGEPGAAAVRRDDPRRRRPRRPARRDAGPARRLPRRPA